MSTEAENNYNSQVGSNQPIASKTLGVYPQKQNGLFMQRIKILGGRINWPQWRKIAQLAQLHSPGFPLHITTRQDIELHNINAEAISDIHRQLNAVDLPTFGAGGDSVRNITVCSGCGLDRSASNIFFLAELVNHYLQSNPILLNLPRKFKISFSGCRMACAKPWLNDLGFIAQRDGNFTVIVAGSLGAKLALGIELYRDLPAKEVLPLCVAAIEFFAQHGDRKNRHRARFRHVREKFGDQAFQTELDTNFRRLKTQQSWPDISPTPSDKNIKPLWRLQLPNGNIEPELAFQLADISEPKGVALRINLEHGLELYGKRTIQLPESLAALEAKPIIIACSGSTTCTRGLVNCWVTANSIRQALSDQYLPQMRINISGCPNNCAHSTVADIGLVGMLRKRNGKATECFRLFIGGGNGRNDKLAKQSDIVWAFDIPATIKRLLRVAVPKTPKN